MKYLRDYIAAAFGEVLREARMAAGISQEDLAGEGHVDRTFVSLMERGKRQPALTTLVQLSGPLKVTPGTLVIETVRRLPKPLPPVGPKRRPKPATRKRAS